MTKRSRLYAAFAIVFMFLPAAARVQSQSQSQVAPPSELQKTIEVLAAAHHGHVAVFAKNLATGETVSVNGQTPVQTASVIKLPFMLQAYEQVKAGKLNLAQPLVLTKENQVGGSGILYLMDPGLNLTLKDVLALMMTLSDNTATNMAIDVVGLAPTNQMLARMGLRNTYFYKKVFKPAEGPMPDDQKQFGLGKTTAEEMEKVLESIWRCDLGASAADREMCAQMITIMRNQQYRDMSPRYLAPADNSESLSAIADKLGALDAVRNDVALIYTVRGPVIVSTFTWDNEDTSWTPENKAEILIGRIAQTVVAAWSPAGLSPKVTDLLAPISVPSPK